MFEKCGRRSVGARLDGKKRVGPDLAFGIRDEIATQNHLSAVVRDTAPNDFGIKEQIR
jgi:hypothetical protein